MGIVALLIGQIIVAFIAYCLNSFYTKRLIGYSTFQQIRESDSYPDDIFIYGDWHVFNWKYDQYFVHQDSHSILHGSVDLYRPELPIKQEYTR